VTAWLVIAAVGAVLVAIVVVLERMR